jgi:hypothetical protein
MSVWNVSGASATNAAIVAIVLAIVLPHVMLYLRPSSVRHEILQTGIANITPDLLSSRNPIVIEDGVVDPRDIVRTALSWQHVWASPVEKCAEGVETLARARFTILYFPVATSGTVTVRIASASGDRATIVILEHGRALLIPTGCRYFPSSPDAHRIRVHDPVTALMSVFVSGRA